MEQNLKRIITVGRTVLGALVTAGGIIWATTAANPPDVETLQALLTQLAEQLTAGVTILAGILSTVRGLREAFLAEQDLTVQARTGALQLAQLNVQLDIATANLATKRAQWEYNADELAGGPVLDEPDPGLEVSGDLAVGLADGPG